MELIESYIYEVVKRLPQKGREDIKAELHGLIEDMLQERCGDNEPSEGDVKAVLTELGDPSKLAGKYSNHVNYLIGPHLFDTYLLVLKIVILVSAFGVCVGLCVDFIVHPPVNAISGIGNVFSSVLYAAFQSFTFVTIIFALNERYNQNVDKLSVKKKWNVADLSPVPNQRALIKKSECIVGIVFSVIFIILFNYSNELFGIYYFDQNKFNSITPMFSQSGIAPFLPVITALFCLPIVKEILKLIAGRWSLKLGIACAAISMISLIGTILIFSNPVIWNSNFIDWIFSHGFISDGRKFANGFVAIFVIIFSIEIIVSIAKGIRYNK